MKHTIILATLPILTGSLQAADAAKDEIIAAAQQLGQKSSYSWHTTTVVPESSQFKPGPMTGKTEKDGFTHISWTLFDNEVQIVRKGDKAAYTDREGAWQLANEQGPEGPGRWMSMFARNLPVPVQQVAEIAGGMEELSRDGNVCSGDLTEKGAKALMTFGRDGEGPSITNATGTVKFWLKDGELTKYEFKVQGLMEWNGNPVDIDRDTTVEIKEVGATKIEVPEAAQTKLGF